MKKKLLLLLLAMAILTTTLVGCISKPPHKMFSDPWGDYEKITYEVTRTLKDNDDNKENDKKIAGESVIITERLNNTKIAVGNKNIENFSGTLVSINTSFDDGSIMEAKVAFKASFEPVASYKHIKVRGYEFNSPAKDSEQTVSLYYNDEKCYYETNIDGKKTNSSEKTGEWIKKPFYDNLMLYHIARSSYLDGNFTALQTKVFSVEDFTMKVLNVSQVLKNVEIDLAPKAQEKADEEDKKKGIKCDIVQISLNQTFPGSGSPMEVALTKEEVKDYLGLNFKTDRVPVRITEGPLVYTIKSYTTTK